MVLISLSLQIFKYLTYAHTKTSYNSHSNLHTTHRVWTVELDNLASTLSGSKTERVHKSTPIQTLGK